MKIPDHIKTTSQYMKWWSEYYRKAFQKVRDEIEYENQICARGIVNSKIYDWDSLKALDKDRYEFPLVIGDTIYYTEEEKRSDELAEVEYCAESCREENCT